MIGKSALRLDKVNVRFRALAAVRDFSLAILPSERRVIIGPNGAGKTTLFNLISGDLRPISGEVRFFGRNVCRLPTERRIRLGMRRTYQTALVFGGLTVRECLFLGIRGLGKGRFAIESNAASYSEMDEADRIGESVGLGHVLHKLAGELSHGDQRQLELGMASSGKPRLLLLDEPTAGLSAAERQRLLSSLQALPREITLLMIEHDMEIALAIADRVTVMHDGRQIAEGTPAEIVSDAMVHDMYMRKHAT